MTVTVIWLGSPSTIPAGGPQASGDPVSDSVQTDLQAIRDDIAELRKSVDALREALLQRSTPPDFSPVSIRIESPDGRPLPGFAVGLNSTGSEARRVTATGESDVEGLALSRDMPYGQYTLWVRHPAGWSTAFRKVTVEIGKPLEQIVIAPDPDERAALQIRSSLDQRAFAGLRFGQRRDYTPEAAYAVSYVPEPGLEDSQFPRFPTLGAGILQAAARIEIAIEQEIRQPGGDLQTWHWRLGEQAFPKTLLAATGLVISIADYEGGVHRPDVSARYFRPQEPPALPTRRSNFSVGYLAMRPAEHGQPVFGADIPPGRATVSVTRFLGQAAPDVMDALNAEVSSDQQLWLEAPMSGASDWVATILDLEGWERGDSISFYARKVMDVAPGESVTLDLQSP